MVSLFVLKFNEVADKQFQLSKQYALLRKDLKYSQNAWDTSENNISQLTAEKYTKVELETLQISVR